ncbi:hypothetical protein [Acidilobus sp.]|jgi:hypothetical protein|uniref:hypothetical protein n=1 Tax=Acidilobus sp. TaxID=1872109 RepID=UPI003D038818
MPAERVKLKLNGDTVIAECSGRAKEIRLPKEVAASIATSPWMLRLVESLCSDSKFRKRLTSSGALESLFLLIYAMSEGLPPYRAAKLLGVSHERLYRLRRGLEKDGLYAQVKAFIEINANMRKRASA